MTNVPTYALNALHDIVEPSSVSYWPPAPGGVMLVLFVVAVVLAVTFRLLLKVRRNRYRTVAGALVNQAVTVQDVSVVLKRAALVVWPRERVASLYGQEWAEFLSSSCSGVHFQDTAFDDPAEPASDDLLAAARLWLRDHKGPLKEEG